MVSMYDTEENVHFMQILLHIITFIMDSIYEYEWMVQILSPDINMVHFFGLLKN